MPVFVMKNPSLVMPLVISLLAGTVGLRAEIRPAALFRDGAVLQRAQPVPVWGTAIAREEIRVQFGAQMVATVADAQGRWKVVLAPLAAASTPAELKVTGSQSQPVRVANVLVGEVWLCAGQSNMGFRVSRSLKAKADAGAFRYPSIRQFDVPTLSVDEPRTEIESTWIETEPETVRMFTAVGFYFALELHRALGVPVGFIRAAPGGTRIEAWMSPTALASDPAFAVVGESWRVSVTGYNVRRAANDKARADWATAAAAAKTAGVAFPKAQPAEMPGLGLAAPSGLYHGMIHPLLPYALRGFVWYQGESNHTRAAEYRALFPAMIRQWRRDFGQGELPFYFVQLANYEQPSDKTGRLWAYLREAQAAALVLPNTGMAVTVDVGEAKNLHPPNKQEVGRRLALYARAKVYGEMIACESPRALGFEKAGHGLRVRLSEAAGLDLRDGKSGGAEIAGADRVFHPASIRVEGDGVLFVSTAVPAPVAVRYAWKNAPETSLYNGAGLPVAPFRSDDW